jgi:putative serine protease PepD
MIEPYGAWTSAPAEPPTMPPVTPPAPPVSTLPAPPWPPTSSAPPASSRGWLRGAIGGAVAGALAASLIGAAWFRDDQTTAPSSAPAAVNTALTSSTNDVHSVVEKAQASVVAIEFNTTSRRGPFSVQGSGAGSGVIISSDGLVLTNAHVVESASNLSVTLSDGSKYNATIVGSDASRDIALLQLQGASNLAAATLGSSDALRVGDDVVAIGNALDLDGTLTVTSGIVSAKDRSLTSSDNSVLADLIQTDAAINSGNSGGPLLNMAGEVVGINTAIIQDSQNLGFSIAIDSIKPLIDTLQN